MAGQRIVETVEFKTQIHIAWDGTEQRMALRENPRRTISYKYTGVKTVQSQYLRSLIYNSQTTKLEFPLWSGKTDLYSGIYKDQSQVFLNREDLWPYRYCHAVLLWDNDDFGGERLALKKISADGLLHLAKQTESEHQVMSSQVVPVFWGVLNKEDSYCNYTTTLAEMNINIEFMPNILAVDLPIAIDEYNYPRLIFTYAKNAPEKYQGEELFLMKSAESEDESISYSRNANRLDNESGVFLFDLKSDDVTSSKTIEFLPATKAELHFLQRFFYRCKGMQHSFYAPTWTNDITLVQDAFAGSIVIYTEFQQYWQYYKNNKRRKAIIVFYIDGTVDILALSGYSLYDDGSMGKIYLANKLVKSINKNKVRMISFLCKWRLSSDKLTTEYETTDIAKLSLSMQEVDE